MPVDIDSETISLYNSLKQYGYNLFDYNDSFYNDICTPYTTINNTDIILLDRKNIIYTNNGNKTICQNNCKLRQYNSTDKKASCGCSVQEEIREPHLEDATFEFNKVTESFFKVLKNSNFLVLKCYKLVFNSKYILKNIGFFLMSIILLISIILILIFFFKEKNRINYFIESVLKIKFFLDKNKLNSEKKLKREKIGPNKSKFNNNKNMSSKKKLVIYDKKKIEQKNDKKIKIKINKKNTININKRIKVKENDINFDNSIYSLKKEFQKEINSLKTLKLLKNNNKMTDYELNSLKYEIALKKDKRNYIQYYWSLLKKKHLILFTFLPTNDYNLICIKISLFLFSFSLSLTINGFFFSDETMHKIYVDNGAFDLLYQLAQIIYSTLICAVINTILKLLSLSESNILEIKKQKNLKKALIKSQKIKIIIIIKFIIFFIFNFVLLLFFWYFISCFCVVFNNTQIILINDTLISFGLSMVYPFITNLLPGLFRIPALRAKNKDKNILYDISLLIALI